MILAKIEAFLAKTGMSEREFGMQSVRDHKFVGRLRSGVGVTLTSVERIETFMLDYREPEESAPIPEPSEQTAA